MTTLITKYPTFEANQVLTSEHLNQLFSYLDDQNRLTRTHLIGIGIVCGLAVRLSGTTITVEKGCGITSEGYVISEPADVNFVACKNYTAPSTLEYPYFKASGSAQFQLLELFSTPESGTTPLSAIDLTNKAVLLFLELRKDNLRNCSVNNCDDKGAEVTVTLRRLLIEKADLNLVISKLQLADASLKSTTDLENNLLARLNLADFALPRLELSGANLNTSNSIIQATRNALGSGLVTNLANALALACDVFKPLLGNVSMVAAKAKLLTLGAEINLSSKITHLQNYYDFIDDLIKAYDEFRWTGFDLMCMCNPSEGLFPRHLMLGLLNPSSVANPQLYRNRFLASPASNRCEEKAAVLAQLFKRIVSMIDGFNSQPALHTFTDIVDDKEIRITPTQLGDVSLSQKAIPYYYQSVAGSTPLYQLWNAEKTHRNRAAQNQSYRSFEYTPAAPNATLNPLKYDLAPYPFLRIEGHLHKTKQAVINTLNAYKAQYRLPIEIIALETGEIKSKSPNQVYFDTLKEFLAEHPGIQHKAGVPMGGTFVVVCHGNSDSESISGGGSLTKDTVISDFYLPYPVLTKAEAGGQRLVKECEYEWIDSVKHLNNLMLRSYRLVKTSKAPAAAEYEREKLSGNYVIRIYKYVIQGVDLLGGSAFDIAIPLATLKAKRLNALATALNNKFPKGLVFDCKDNANQLVLRYLEGHDFRIELGGLQGNQIRYAYTQEGVSRWQHKVWESIQRNACCASPCKILAGKYQEKDYEWLQTNFPSALRSVSAMPSVKEVIAWEKLTLRRTRVYADVKKLPISSLLEKIVNNIKAIDPSAKVQLIGSWANGSWVSSERLENVASFEKLVDANSRFEAAYRSAFGEFLTLRHQVTGKSENHYSDIDLLIDSSLEITADMIHVPSIYKINLMKGSADSQKGLPVAQEKRGQLKPKARAKKSADNRRAQQIVSEMSVAELQKVILKKKRGVPKPT